MKILILSWRDIKHPWKGGAEVYLHEIAKKIVQYGHQVTYFAATHPGGSLPTEEIDGVKIIRHGNRFTVYLWAFWYYLTKFRGQFDVIIDQANGIPFFSPAYITSTPVICLVHHIFKDQWFKEIYFPFNYLGYYLEKYLLPFAYKYNHFVAVSDSTKQDMIKYFGLKEDKINIVHNAIASYYKKSSAKTTHPSIVYVGRLKKYKQIDILIRALLRILYKYPQLKLHIIGTGDSHDELKKLATRLGIAKSIIFHGYVSEKLKVDLLSSAWLLVNPSSHEGWGLTIMEAAACGTTAIGSRIPGICDAIIDQETGLLAESANIYDLSSSINQVLSNAGLRYKLEKQAYLRSQKFTWGKSTQKFIKICQKVMYANRQVSSFKPLKTKQLQHQKLPLVSIIIPTKNVASFVQPCFESIKNQSYPNIELIVVDNYSTDGTYQLAKNYTNHVYSQGPERNQQRNYAVSKASGQYLMFIDSDMKLDSELVADCVYRLERYSKSVAVILPELQIGHSIWSQARALEKEFNLGDETVESPR
ncbi:MAG: glycosyltransferase, partial [Patescibacteria group bacterium]